VWGAATPDPHFAQSAANTKKEEGRGIARSECWQQQYCCGGMMVVLSNGMRSRTGKTVLM